MTTFSLYRLRSHLRRRLYSFSVSLSCALLACLVTACEPLANSETGNSQYTASISSTLMPTDLKTESQFNPIGVGRKSPRLSWRSAVNRQIAYEIEVASSDETLLNGSADLWASGRVVDGRSVAVPYGGKTLKSAQSAFWRVRIWQEGEARPGEWSETGVWQMGLLNQSDWEASWITSPIFPLDYEPNLSSCPPGAGA